MKATTVPGMQPFQYAFVADSGRTYLVKVAHIGPQGEGHEFQYTAGPVDSTGAYIGVPEVLTRSIHRDGIAARSHGYVDFWKAFTNIPAQDSGMATVTVPAGLTSPGPTVVAGENWYAGHRDAARNTNDPNVLCPTVGARGDWYVDLDSGTTWKKRMGELEWMAFLHAQFQEHRAMGDDYLSSLQIPAAMPQAAS